MNQFDTYETVGDYEISNTCLETHPCKHYIRYKKKECAIMSGDVIFCLLASKQLSSKHFDKYAERVKYSPETIAKYAEDLESSKLDERLVPTIAVPSIVDQYKASSRLDKLRKINNVL